MLTAKLKIEKASHWLLGFFILRGGEKLARIPSLVASHKFPSHIGRAMQAPKSMWVVHVHEETCRLNFVLKLTVV